MRLRRLRTAVLVGSCMLDLIPYGGIWVKPSQIPPGGSELHCKRSHHVRQPASRPRPPRRWPRPSSSRKSPCGRRRGTGQGPGVRHGRRSGQDRAQRRLQGRDLLLLLPALPREVRRRSGKFRRRDGQGARARPRPSRPRSRHARSRRRCGHGEGRRLRHGRRSGNRRAQGRLQGRDLLFLLPALPREVRCRSGKFRRRDGQGARARPRPSRPRSRHARSRRRCGHGEGRRLRHGRRSGNRRAQGRLQGRDLLFLLPALPREVRCRARELRWRQRQGARARPRPSRPRSRHARPRRRCGHGEGRRLRHGRRSGNRRAQGRLQGRDLLFLLRPLPRALRRRVRTLPASRRPPGRAGAGGHRIHLPDAPGDPPDRPRHLHDLRHGPGADGDDRRHRPQSRTHRHDPPLLDRSGADRAGGGAGDGRPSRPRPAGRSTPVGLGPARAGDPGGAVGRLAVLRARGPVVADAQPQHVHADLDRHRRRLGLQHRRHAGARRLPAGFPRS